MSPIGNLEQKIDTNKNNIMETQEIINFLKNEDNVRELGNRLNQPNQSFLDRQKNQKFTEAIYNATLNNQQFQNRINSIIKKGVGGLTDSDVFLLYLQSKVDNFGTTGMIIITANKGDIYTRYGGTGLLQYIRTKYKNHKYEFWKGWPNILTNTIQNNQKKARESQITRREPSLPNNIDFSTFGENNTYMAREFGKLDTWAKNNFPSEYNKEKNASRKRNAEKGDLINDYIQYDLLIFSLKKYQEHIEKKNNGIINGIYGNEQQCKFQQNLAKLYFEDLEKIDNEFPDIQEIIKKITGYFKDLEELQKKYLGNQKEEIIKKKYESYLKEVDNKGKELGVNKQEMPTEITNFEDVVKILENTEKISKFQASQEEIKKKYGVIIDKYENYINEKGNLINKYGKDNLQKWMESYKKYGEKVKDCKDKHRQKGFDEKKYNEYIKKISESDIPRHMENIQILYNNINIKDGKVPENFPIRSIKEDYERIQKEQEETDKRRENLKNKSRLLYQICNIGSRGINALVSSTRGTGAKLGALVCSLWHDDDEMVAVWERANNGFWNPNIPISKRQSQSAYENGKIILNWDNGPGIVSEGIVNMLTLVAGGGAITKGLAKGATKFGVGMGAKLAKGAGLVSSGFIQQAGPSFGEGLSAGMTGNQAMLYAITSATLQGSLELISPNEFINGLGKNLAKTYIKEILKSESKQSLKAIGKMFMKNVGSEIGEEIFQEEVQLVAGNLINMWANNQYDLGINGLNADWNPKNFAATALVTALTTGFVAGGGFAMQTPGMGNTQNRTQLIEEINKNTELRENVMNVLDNAINGKIKIPNINIQLLQELKDQLNGLTTNETIHIQAEGYKAGTDIIAKIDEKTEIRAEIESYDPTTKVYKVTWEEKGKKITKSITAENMRKPMDTEFALDKGNSIRRYKTELPTEELNETHIQETETRLNELITEQDKPKLKQQGFKKEYPDGQCEKDVQRFIERAQRKEIAHKEIFLDLGKEANAQALFIGLPKKADRIVDKVKNEYRAARKGGLENITDFTRSTLLFDNYNEFIKGIEVLKQMQKEGRIAKLRIKNRIGIRGCNDMLINIETPDGYVSEVQFHIPETLILKDGYLGPQTEKLYKEKFDIEFDKYIFTEEIYDLKTDDEYPNKKNKYEEIINVINKVKNKEFKFPEQGKEIHGHDVYDIKRIVENWENDPELLSEEIDINDVISLNNTLGKINDALADEARRRYGNRTILQ